MTDGRRIINEQKAIWQSLLREHGATVRGAGSESAQHKTHRYERLCAAFGQARSFSVHDVGCGFGDLFAFLNEHFGDAAIEYSGSDIVAASCEQARARHPAVRFEHRDIIDAPNDERYDFVVMSGIFHQRGTASDRDWFEHMTTVIRAGWLRCRKGIIFNVLSQYADYHDARHYYALLHEVQDFILRDLSRFFVVDHASPLFEATFSVFRKSHIASLHPEPVFDRYLHSGGDDVA